MISKILYIWSHPLLFASLSSALIPFESAGSLSFSDRQAIMIERGLGFEITGSKPNSSLAVDDMADKLCIHIEEHQDKCSRRPTLETLPIELKQAILRQMDLPTLRCIRLASRFWGELGEEYLIDPAFRSFPHRDDFSRLLSISQHPPYATRIESIEINLGEMNEYHGRFSNMFLVTLSSHFFSSPQFLFRSIYARS